MHLHSHLHPGHASRLAHPDAAEQEVAYEAARYTYESVGQSGKQEVM